MTRDYKDKILYIIDNYFEDKDKKLFSACEDYLRCRMVKVMSGRQAASKLYKEFYNNYEYEYSFIAHEVLGMADEVELYKINTTGE